MSSYDAWVAAVVAEADAVHRGLKQPVVSFEPREIRILRNELPRGTAPDVWPLSDICATYPWIRDFWCPVLFSAGLHLDPEGRWCVRVPQSFLRCVDEMPALARG
jgi:hypothetical protein